MIILLPDVRDDIHYKLHNFTLVASKVHVILRRRVETSIPEGTNVNEVSGRSTPRPMPTGHRSRSMELLPPFESRH